ncbi:anaphase-promoting complex component apc8 [Balamuthia mandrillaris]
MAKRVAAARGGREGRPAAAPIPLRFDEEEEEENEEEVGGALVGEHVPDDQVGGAHYWEEGDSAEFSFTEESSFRLEEPAPLFLASSAFNEGRTPAKLRRSLLAATKLLSSRGLCFAAKFAAEQAVCLASQGDGEANEQNREEEEKKVEDGTLPEEELTGEEEASLLLAKTYFDVKEYERAASVLRDCSSGAALFLRGYASFLAGEKRKEEESLEAPDQPARNANLLPLYNELRSLLAKDEGSLDGLCLYVLGLVLKELGHIWDALSVLSAAVMAYPWNWSAWKDLAGLVASEGHGPAMLLMDELNLPCHVMRDFFYAHLTLELQQNTECLRILDVLLQFFPTSKHLVAQKAMAHYNLREFEDAEEHFETLQRIDPYGLELMDIYSNILYVKEEHAKLSYLAHQAHKIDKYREETCCIIGNYYSLKSEHAKAIQYFSRALKLNSKYLSAWTLMGHEYVELKNPSAAIRAYRKAVEISERDYRAWYGLGQTYEILKMPLYALYYYRKATLLRPYDARMWCAMAGCYESLPGRQELAIKCYERAEMNSDREGIALSKLAKLWQEQGKEDKAAHYYMKEIQRRDEEGAEGQDTVDALLFLAQYMKKKGELKQAEGFCLRLLDYAGREKEEAKAMLREIYNTLAASQEG